MDGRSLTYHSLAFAVRTLPLDAQWRHWRCAVMILAVMPTLHDVPW